MSDLEEFRARKDEFFATDHHSPLTPHQRSEFRGLAYYDENPTLSLEVEVEEFPHEDPIEIATSTGDVATYQRWGRFSFEVEGQKAELTIFRDLQRGDLFLPFVDSTSGNETYSVGRYVEPEPSHDGKVLVDFNQAYNPYCAYNENWSCPIPPVENRIKVPIHAGEKSFPGTTHQ